MAWTVSATLRFFAVLLLGAVVVGSATPRADGAELVPVRAAYTPATPWLLAWVAKERGFFERRGLDVNLTEVQNLSVLPTLVGNHFDVASSTPPDLIKAVVGGLDVVAIAGGIVEESTSHVTELVVRADSGITTLKDLRGKIIGAPTIGAVNHVATLYWLKQSGVDPDSVQGIEIPFPFMAAQLQAGKVDAVEPVTPFAGAMLSAGNVSLGDPLLSVADPARGNLWIAQGKWARTHATIVSKWIAAHEDARDFIASSPAEARTIVAKYTRLPEQVVQKIPLPHFVPRITSNDIDPWIKVLTELGQVTGRIDAGNLIVTPD
jgi:NitT/TauT family transport system substrate-binding protein